MKNLLCLLLLISLTSYSQSKNETGKSTVIAKKLLIQDNIERVIYDYTQVWINWAFLK